VISERSDRENEAMEVTSGIEWYKEERTGKENLNETKWERNRPLYGNMRGKAIDCHSREGRK
jgi:hypothetical protein